MGYSGREASLLIALFTLIESFIWTALSIFGLLIYYCEIEVPWGEFTIVYFYNIQYCYDPLVLTFDVFAGKTFSILIAYVVLSSLWVLTSLVMMVGSRSKMKASTFYPWSTLTVITLLADVAAMITFLIDFSKNVTVRTNTATIIMSVISIRGVILWLVNAGLLRYGFKIYFKERDSSDNKKKVQSSPESSYRANWIFSGGQSPTKDVTSGDKENPNNWNVPPQRIFPHGYSGPPSIEPVIEELKQRNSSVLQSNALKTFQDPSMHNKNVVPPKELQRNHSREPYAVNSNSPTKLEPSRLAAGAPRWTSPATQGNDRAYSNDSPNVWDKPPNPQSNGMNRTSNYYEPIGKVSPTRTDVNKRTSLQNGEYSAYSSPSSTQNLTKNAATNRRVGDSPSPRPAAKDNLRGGNRFDDYREKDKINKQLDPYSQMAFGKHVRKGSDGSSQSSDEKPSYIHGRNHRAESDESSRSANTPVAPKGLNNQYPWSYVLPQLDFTAALKKRQRHTPTHEEDIDDSPPVPVPDYTLHFNRVSERPVISRTP